MLTPEQKLQKKLDREVRQRRKHREMLERSIRKSKNRHKATKGLWIFVKMRDGHCCQVCGSQWMIEIHHIIPKSRGGRNVEENCICLCFICHREGPDSAHSNIPKWIPIFQSMILDKYWRAKYNERIGGKLEGFDQFGFGILKGGQRAKEKDERGYNGPINKVSGDKKF